MSSLPFCKADPAHQDFQYLEDLSTAYWYSEVLFAAIELEIFDSLERGISSLDDLAAACTCRKKELQRLLKAMETLALVHQKEGQWFNSQVARMFLLNGHPSYLGDFLLYRRYMQPNWQCLVEKVSIDKDSGHTVSQDDDYALRTLNYVKVTDALIREKSKEIVNMLKPSSWDLPVLDIGGGAGSLALAMIRKKIEAGSVSNREENSGSSLFELPEVIKAARKIYNKESDWDKIETIGADFRSYEIETDKQYGLVVLSNFLHAYGSEEARALLAKAVRLVKSGGLILIHDYFPDRRGRSPQKGTLYDLNMMLNTYDGMCHEANTLVTWLEDAGLNQIRIRDLSTDTSIITASKGKSKTGVANAPDLESGIKDWVYAALEEGFQRAVLLPAGDIVAGAWVRKKCRFGCDEYGNNLRCPPYGMESHETKEMVGSYSWSLVLEGMPPGRDFHKKLLALEKKAFLAGFQKAFVFGAGPCPVCDKCPEDNVCRHTDIARPSMEASGMDVYETAKAAGIKLDPVLEKDRYVKYIGLLLLE